MSFYNAACKMSFTFPFDWWGDSNILEMEDYYKAREYKSCGRRGSPEESFMFLLFVALAEGEEF